MVGKLELVRVEPGKLRPRAVSVKPYLAETSVAGVISAQLPTAVE